VPKVSVLLAARRDLAQLEARFGSAREYYDELRETCEARVVRWEWANASAYSLDPLFFLDKQIELGRVRSVAPKNPAEWTAYGLARDDRVVVEREYTELRGSHYQDFYLELADRVVGYRFDYSASRAVINCAQLVMSKMGPSYFQLWGQRGWVSSVYADKDGRIESFVRVAKQPDRPEIRISGKVVYKDHGVVELWRKEPGHPRAKLSFRKRRPVGNPFLRARDS
jgi:hypothetical protein